MPGTVVTKPGGTNTGGPTPGGPKTGDTGTTPDSGTPTGGTLPTVLPDEPVPPPTDTGTKPTPIPGTLLPPTTDLPGQTNDPAKTPVKHADVPEPGTLWLAGAGVAALLAARRAKKRPRD